MSKSWDSSILKKLKALMGKGLSTAEIGKKLGISKNAVVGKLHRMGWNSAANESVEATIKKSGAKKPTPVKKTTNKKSEPVKASKPAKEVKVAKPAKKEKTAPKPKAAQKKSAPVAKETKPVKAPVVAAKPRVSLRAAAGKGAAVHQRIVQHALEMANLKPNQCRWPIGDPDSDGFHFCGATVFVGKPYCYEHCKQAYQFTPPKKK